MCNEERKGSPIPFINLHAHSGYSKFDGLAKPGVHMEFAWKNGMDALALTDHGTCNGLADQVQHAMKMHKEGKNFKPIYGAEMYFVPSIEEWRVEYNKSKGKKSKKSKEEEDDSQESHKDLSKYNDVLRHRRHLLVLAINPTGLKNLFCLISESHFECNYYYFPRVDLAMLRKYSEGLIVTSSCLGGIYGAEVFASLAKTGGLDLAYEKIKDLSYKFLDIFGDRWYGEIQFNNIPEQAMLNQLVVKVTKELGFKSIATADCHYPSPEAWHDRELYRRIGHVNRKNKPAWLGDGMPCNVEEIGFELFPKNGQQMLESYHKYSAETGLFLPSDFVMSSIKEAHEIGQNKIESFFPDTKVKLPSFAIPKDKTPEDALWEAIREGAKKRGVWISEQERLKEEFEVITTQGFAQYFMTMKFIMDRARSESICGPARGSAAGSLVAYCLDITQVNPLKYDLVFSRFLTRNAKGYPDIDVDISSRGRQRLIDLMKKEFGDTSVIPITNYITFKVRNFLKDLAKFHYGEDIYSEVNAVTTVMLDEAEPAIKQERGQTAGVLDPPASYLEIHKYSPSLQEFAKKYPDIHEKASSLYGNIRAIGKHAAGILFYEDLHKHMPLIRSKGELQTPWSEGMAVRNLEPLGFIKFDVLGLSTLDIFEDCIELILKRTNPNPSKQDILQFYNDNIHPDVIDLDDQRVYENVFHDGNYLDTFQYTGDGAQNFCQEVKPRNIIDSSVITSIYRPGPLEAGVHKDYTLARENPQSVKYEHKKIEEVLKGTLGFIVFQEDFMSLAAKLGENISLDESNDLRKLITKKGLTGDTASKLEKLKERFIQGSIKEGLYQDEAKGLWEKMKNFAAYGFSKNHAVPYSIISFQCAHLFTYYPKEWAAACLNNTEEKKKAAKIALVRQFGFEVSPPTLNESQIKWSVGKNGNLLQPISSLKGVGDKAVETLMEHRPFYSLFDLLYRPGIDRRRVNRKVLRALVLSGALDDFINDEVHNRKYMLEIVEGHPKKQEDYDEFLETLGMPIEFTQLEKLQHSIEIMGVYPVENAISDKMLKALEREDIPKISTLKEKDKGGVCWAVLTGHSIKTSKKGKDYIVLEVVDDTYHNDTIKCFSYKGSLEGLTPHQPYLFEVQYDRWGFKVWSLTKNIIDLKGVFG